MRIVHYILGFPSYRSGGMTKFAMSLMKEQVNMGHDVIALWPGRMKFFDKNIAIKEHPEVFGIRNLEIVNPLPVSLDEGITNFSAYTAACDSTSYGHFLDSVAPEIIHIHTFMGLHREFVDEAKKRGIKTVFTTHDYYPVCAKVNLVYHGTLCNQAHECVFCEKCNQSALPIWKIWLLQSPLYRGIKNFRLTKMLRRKHRDQFFAVDTADSGQMGGAGAGDYQKLRGYYLAMLSLIDWIHYNSSVSKSVYESYIADHPGTIISITHEDIRNNIDDSGYRPGDVLRITYLAQQNPIKGYGVLKEALDSLWDVRKDFILNVFFTPDELPEYMVVKGEGYDYKERGDIFTQTDVLVAPSVCYETFGFTVLEALSFGVPVIVSDSVGAKDIIGGGGKVVEAGSATALRDAIDSLSEEKLCDMRRWIRRSFRPKLISALAGEIDVMYKSVLST